MNLQNYFNYLESVIINYRDPYTGEYMLSLKGICKILRGVNPEYIRHKIIEYYGSKDAGKYIIDRVMSDGRVETFVPVYIWYDIIEERGVLYPKLFTLWILTKESMELFRDNSLLKDIYEIELLGLREIAFKEINDLNTAYYEANNFYRTRCNMDLFNPDDCLNSFISKITNLDYANYIRRYYSINSLSNLIPVLSKEGLQKLIWYCRICKYWVLSDMPGIPTNIFNNYRFSLYEPPFATTIINDKRLVNTNGRYSIVSSNKYFDTDREIILSYYDEEEVIAQGLADLHIVVKNGIPYFRVIDLYNIMDIKNYNNRKIVRRQESLNEYYRGLNSVPDNFPKVNPIDDTKKTIYPVEVLNKDIDFYQTVDNMFTIAKEKYVIKDVILELPKRNGSGTDLYISAVLIPLTRLTNTPMYDEMNKWMQFKVLPIIRRSYFFTEMNKYINMEINKEMNSKSYSNNCDAILSEYKLSKNQINDIKSVIYSIASIRSNSGRRINSKIIYSNLINLSISCIKGFNINPMQLKLFLEQAKYFKEFK